ncbi:MAG TPA: heavy-metal-associated domain-containing protein [Longimicrobiales bacterium]
MARAVLKVTGMTCGHCEKAVTNALRSIGGVSDARVELQNGRAVVEYDEAQTSPRALATAVMNEGYMAEEVA